MDEKPETAQRMTPLYSLRIDRRAPALDAGAEITHPISLEAARDRFRPLVGMVRDLTFLRLRDDWWDRLAAATSPEEKLTCERMINAANFAYGLSMHERGAEIAHENRQRQEAERVSSADERALRRWR